jgi:hypothetical protein
MKAAYQVQKSIIQFKINDTNESLRKNMYCQELKKVSMKNCF